MTKRDVLSLALKILGIYSIVYIVTRSSSMVLSMNLIVPTLRSGELSIWIFIVSLVPIIFSFIIAFILLRRGDLIARKLIKDDKDIPSLSSMDWERLLFILSLRIAGVLTLLRGLPMLANSIIRLRALKETQRIVTSGTWGSLISAIVLLILGVYLLFGAKGFARFILKDKKPADTSPKSGKIENLL